MSVVNQMLHDLQRRESVAPRGHALRLYPGGAANDSSGPGRDRRPLLIVLFSLGALAFLLAALLQAPRPATSVAKPLAHPFLPTATPQPMPAVGDSKAPMTDAKTAAISATTPGPEAVAAQPATAVDGAPPVPQLGRMRSGWQPGRTRFVFKFDRAHVAVQLEQRDAQHLLLRFAAGADGAELPAIPPQDTLLDRLVRHATADGLEYEFVARGDQVLNARYHRMTQDGDWPHWVILDLHAPESAAGTAETDVRPPANAPTAASDEPIATRQADTDRVGTTADTPVELAKRPLPVPPAQQAGEHLAEAAAALRRGDSAGAVRSARLAVTLDPQSAGARAMLAGLLMRNNEQAEAGALLATGLALQPDHLGMARLQARLLLGQDRDREALQVLAKAAAHGADDAEFLALRASAEQRLELHEQAAASYLAALRLDRRQASWWLGLGLSLEALQHQPDARAAYGEALSRDGLTRELRDYAQARLAAIADSGDN